MHSEKIKSTPKSLPANTKTNALVGRPSVGGEYLKGIIYDFSLYHRLLHQFKVFTRGFTGKLFKYPVKGRFGTKS